MYFKFDSDVFSLSDPDSLTFKITWLDKNQNSTWALKYYNSLGLQTALNLTGIGDNQWKTTNVTIQNPIITQNGVLGSDFMLVNTDNIDDIFHGIEVDITRANSLNLISYSPDNSETLIFPSIFQSEVVYCVSLTPSQNIRAVCYHNPELCVSQFLQYYLVQERDQSVGKNSFAH